jgi:hypothetical protein
MKMPRYTAQGLFWDLRPSARRRHRAGILLAECLVYISLFFVLTGISYGLYFRTMEFSRGLQRNSDEIVRALKAGERWREDVRRAVGPLVTEMHDGVAVNVIPQSDGSVLYWLHEGTLWRQTPANAVATPLCRGVKSSNIVRDARQSVTAWRWEIELKTQQKTVRLKPLFSFLAVTTNLGKSTLGSQNL